MSNFAIVLSSCVFFVLLNIALNFKIYSVCQKLGLNPPFPLAQFEIINFMFYIWKKAKLEEYCMLKKWCHAQLFFQIILALNFIVLVFIFTG